VYAHLTVPPVASAMHILITGASRGLGRAIALALAGPGVVIGVHFGHDATAARRTVDDLHARGAQAYGVAADFNDDTAVAIVAKAVRQRDVPLGMLVLNAGVVAPAPLVRTSAVAWDHVMNVTARQHIRLVNELVPRTMARDGHIVVIGSLTGLRGGAGAAAYAAAQGVMLGFVRDAAARWGAHGIRVNAILPGVLPTAMTGNLTDAAARRLASENVLGMPTPLDDVASFVAMLHTQRHISGQTFALDNRLWPDGRRNPNGLGEVSQ